MHKTSARLLALLSLLQTRRDRSAWAGWPGDDLAERLGVTPRTVRRDVDRLRELGYPITAVKGPAGGYRLDAGTHLPPLLFDDDQAVVLALALRTASAAAGTALADDAARALATVRQVMPPRLRHRMDNTVHVTAVPSAPYEPAGNGPDTPPAGTRLIADLSAAVHAREELRFDYAQATAGDRGGERAQGQGPERRRVQPHHLVAWRGRWYLLAWDLDREDWRTFRADRLHPRTPTGPRFTPRELPGGDVAAFVTGRFRGSGGTTADWPCRGQAVLALPAAEVIPYAHDAVVEELAPDRCRVALGSWSWPGLAAAFGRFDADIEAVTPPELADAFAQLAARYAAAASRRGASR
ncbi:helix-turn-helix transcriptional regulator [Streptodolium elevatio]